MKIPHCYSRFCLLAPLIGLAFLTGCRFDPRDGLSWDADVLTPIAFSEVSILDAIDDTTRVRTNSDQTLSIVYRDTIAGNRLEDYVEIPDTSLRIAVTLDSLNLAPGVIEQRISLGFLALQLIAQGDPTGQAIINAHNSTLPFLLPVTGISSPPVPIDASAFFEFAEIESGDLILTIENDLPIAIENAQFLVQNATGPPPIISDTFPRIESKSQFTETYDMAGKEIESQLNGQLIRLDIPAVGTPVDIDTSDFLLLRLEAKDLRARSATAVFPAQTILDTVEETEYAFEGDFADVQLTKMRVRSGRIEARSISTIEDTLQFTYSLPSAERNGEIPTVSLKLNPATGGQPTEQVQEADLAGFNLDLTLGGTTFNTLEQAYKVDLVFSGNVVNIDLEDSVTVFFGLLDIEPTYVEGFFGKTPFTFTGEEALDFFDQLEIDRLDLADPQVNIVFANSIGVDVNGTLKSLKGVNSETGKSVNLTGTQLLAGPLRMLGPTLPDTTGLVNTTLSFNRENSNVKQFINNLPDKFIYDLEVLANFNGQPGVFNNFATNESEFNAFFNVEIPLTGYVEGLRFEDTTEINFDPGDLDDLDRLNSGLLRLLLENEFPLQLVSTAIVYDEDWNVIDTLVTDELIPAAEVSPSTGRVEVPVNVTVDKNFTADLLREIIDFGKYLKLSYQVDTQPQGSHVSVYSDYRVVAKMVGQFDFRVQ
ncbi:MAG: hypothetical protein AAGI38_01705 [Bacteroidota bacterium]